LKYKVKIDGKNYSVDVAEQTGGGAERMFKVDVDGKAFDVSIVREGGGSRKPPSFTVSPPKQNGPAPAAKKEQPAAEESAADGVRVEAPMAGKIVAVNVKPGDKVKEGDVVVVLEAMKMENSIASTVSGVVESVAVDVGDVMQKGDALCTINPGG